MFSQRNRLKSRTDFLKVSRYGKFFSFDSVNVKVLANDLEFSRLGISIGIKFSKKAVERNRAKRQIREIFRKKADLVKAGFDIVVMLKPGQKKTITSPELEIMLVNALKKAKVIN